MKKKLLILSSIFLLSACNLKINNTDSSEKDKKVPELCIMEGDHFTLDNKEDYHVDEDGNITYLVNFDEGYLFDKCDYKNIEYERVEPWVYEITFKDVQYDTLVTLSARKLDIFNISINPGLASVYSYETTFSQSLSNQVYEGDTVILSCENVKYYAFSGYSFNDVLDNGGEFLSTNLTCSFVMEKDVDIYLNFELIYKNSIIYHANGTLFSNNEEDNPINIKALKDAHKEINTLAQSGLKRDGYVLVGWNTMSDGSGEHIGIGSKVSVDEDDYIELYAEWKKSEDPSSFTFSNGVITSYIGPDKDIITVPDYINGVKVTSIASNAFASCKAKTYYLPSGISRINDNVFYNSNLEDLYLYDDISYIADRSFTSCTNFKSVHFNAELLTISNGLNRAKGDIYSHIKASKNKKIVVLGGSSVQYGYYSPLIRQLFNDKYEVYNIGQNAGFTGIAQIQAILPYMNSGDIFIHAPEFHSVPIGAAYGGVSPISNKPAANFEMVLSVTALFECDFDILANLNVQSYVNMFDYFRTYNSYRIAYNQAGQGIPYITVGEGLNKYGDIGFDYPVRNIDNDYGYNNFRFDEVMASSYTFDVLKVELKKLQDKGVRTYFTFCPVNRSYMNGIYNSKDVDFICYLYYKHCEGMLGSYAKILLQQQETVYLGRYFANSDVHLCREASITHTNKVIEKLQEDLRGAGYVW